MHRSILTVATLVAATALFTNCSDSSSPGASAGLAPSNSNATFEIACNTQGTTGTTTTPATPSTPQPTGTNTPTASATPVATATPGTSTNTQQVPIIFESSCQNPQTTTAAATPTPAATASPNASPTPVATASATPDASPANPPPVTFAGQQLGPVRVTPDCDRRVVTISAPGSRDVTRNFASDGSFVATILVNEQLERDFNGNSNCTTMMVGHIDGNVSCPNTSSTSTTTTSPTPASTPTAPNTGVTVAMNVRWQFDTSNGATPTTEATPAATPTASPSPVASASPSPAATATATPPANGGTATPVACVLNPNTTPSTTGTATSNDACAFSTPVTLSCTP